MGLVAVPFAGEKSTVTGDDCGLLSETGNWPAHWPAGDANGVAEPNRRSLQSR
jgi:hypothetical protein